MKIYRIDIDFSFKIQLVPVITPFEIINRTADIDVELFVCTGKSKKNNWKPYALLWNEEFRRRKKNIGKPDITYHSITANLFVNAKIKEELEPYTKDYVEYLPVDVENDRYTFYFLNILNCLDALDEENSEFKVLAENQKILKKPVFNINNLIDNNIFTLQGNSLELYFAEEKDDPDNLRTFIEKNNITGITFKLIQES